MSHLVSFFICLVNKLYYIGLKTKTECECFLTIVTQRATEEPNLLQQSLWLVVLMDCVLAVP